MSSLPQLVSTAWLGEHLEADDLRVFDTTVHMSVASTTTYTVESGKSDFDQQHIPGAGFLDLTRELSDRSSPFAFTMPSVEQMSEVLGRAGISAGHRVVVYSASTQMWATRVWWMLRASGIDSVGLLDGGFAKWLEEGRPACSEPCSYPPGSVRCEVRADMWADRGEVLRSIEDGDVCTVNALPRPLHTSESEFSYGRRGRIAGSVNVPYAHLMEEGTQVYRAADQLRAAFEGVGAMDRQRVICYCGGGISATTDAFALTLVGHPNVAVYDGSLREWAEDENLPMEAGDSR